MAINAFELGDKNIPPLIHSLKRLKTPGSVRMIKTNLDDDSTKRGKTKKKKSSPYLHGEKIQLFSRMTEKRLVHKNNEVFSSFPLATNIYRASSDEFKALKKIRHNSRKSVLTLPNVPAPIPKACTVSDMNDSDYFNNKIDKKYTAPRKYLNHNRKSGTKTKGFEFYDDRDARLFEGSSTDLLIKNGDVNAFSNGAQSGKVDDLSVQDVWSVLRNINKFQFNQAPRISDEDSFASKKKKKIFTKKYRNRKGRRLIETCRTEEVAYVANFEISSKTSASQSSSFDRVTVISKTGPQYEPKLEKAIEGTQNPRRNSYKPKNLIPLNDRKPCKIAPKNDIRSKNDVRSKNDNHVAFMNNRNSHENRMFHNTMHAAAIKDKRPETPRTIDSSNCLRLSDYEESNCTLIPNLTHPNEFKEIIYNQDSKMPFNPTNKSLRITNESEISSNEGMTIGMTQMVLNNNNNNVNSVSNKGLQKPKPRLVTTMPSAATMPKLTASDIKRRLAQIKFPLVILGRDQLSSSLEVFDYDPPQFDGLNKHIWPFMLEWKKKNTASKKCTPKPVECISSNLRKVNNELCLLKHRDKKTPYCDISSKKKADFKRGSQPDVFTQTSQKKVRPMRLLKDKMLKLLYKNSYPDSVDIEPIIIKPVLVNASTEMSVIQEEDSNNKLPAPESSNNRLSIVGQKLLGPNKKVAFEEQVSIYKPRSGLDNLNKKTLSARCSWSKAKQASDFVDSVMRKIKNGSYYGIEEIKAFENYNANVEDNTFTAQSQHNGNDLDTDTKEISIQTALDVAQKVDFEQNCGDSQLTLNKNDDLLINIPGFDDAPPNIEITTLSSTQIQVKNCVTNVMLQFDVSLPNKKESYFLEEKSSSSSSYIPLPVINSNAKVYKCSTTILNTVLPAELCTVIPKLMKEIFDSSTTFATATTTPNVNISDLSECESDLTGSLNSTPCGPVINPWSNLYSPRAEQKQQMSHRHNNWRYSPNNQWTGSQNSSPCITARNSNQWTGPQNSNLLIGPQHSNQWISPQNSWTGRWMPPFGWPEYLPLIVSPILVEMLKGRFGLVPRKADSPKHLKPELKLNSSDSMILTKMCTQGLMAILVEPMKSVQYNKHTKVDDTSIDKSLDLVATSNCMALELYKGGVASWISPSSHITSLLQKMWNYCKFNIHFIIPNFINSNSIKRNQECNNITINMMVEDVQGVKNTMSVTITHVNNSYTNFANSDHSLYEESNGTNSENDYSPLKCVDYPKDLDVVTNSLKLLPKKNKFRRKSFTNLHKKCKSASHIAAEKLTTPLSKITNMEEFTLALGAAKTLCSVFDGCSSQKVLACVEKIRLWIKDISPRQALLVLLLANKKDTPNLMRCRSVLLQGIAMNRITRASELEMEIEVIEKENIQVAQCDGINYITATVANQDSLYEELCWIAKTTASDYQKPFDESSEMLLKSLLGKRKKLSPSYLRVMARYVGLGLLKSQNPNW